MLELQSQVEVEKARFADHLRQLVLSGQLAGGLKLREVELAKKFGISRTPVREALVALEREGLLTYAQNRGFRVKSFSGLDLYQAYEVRAVLEGYAAGQLARFGLPDESMTELRGCIWHVDQLIHSKSADFSESLLSWRVTNLKFHRLLLMAFGNSSLERAHRVAMQVPRVHDTLVAPGEETEQAMALYNREHSEILDAIGARDPQRAEFAARDHVMRSCRTVAARLGLELGN